MSFLHTYNVLHHNCQTVGALHGLADAMRRELLDEIADLKAENTRLLAEGGRSDSRVLELEDELRESAVEP